MSWKLRYRRQMHKYQNKCSQICRIMNNSNTTRTYLFSFCFAVMLKRVWFFNICVLSQTIREYIFPSNKSDNSIFATHPHEHERNSYESFSLWTEVVCFEIEDSARAKMLFKHLLSFYVTRSISYCVIHTKYVRLYNAQTFIVAFNW